jgi:UDP-N-acetylglucosamine:LPS N-acetylglucosamine transferase
MSRALNWLLIRVYARQVKRLPKSLGLTFAVTSSRGSAAVVRFVVGLLFAGRLLKVIHEEQPDLVVSTYPLITAALGHLRRSGRLRSSVAGIVADYGAHPLWVAPGVDLHLVGSSYSAELTERAGGKTVLARMPVAPEFRFAPTREEAREALGLLQDVFVALVIGGAWGIGDLEGAARCAAVSGAYTIVVTGNNHELKTHLEEEFKTMANVWVLGWRGDMPVLMAASDCLIQNAGGMTCVEAIEIGLPILIFNPIPGHGELNAQIMERAGAAKWVRTSKDLRALLRLLARREGSLPAPTKESTAPTASIVLGSLAGSDTRPVLGRWVRRRRLTLASAAAVLLCFCLAFSSLGVTLVAKGFRLHIPGYNPFPGKVSLGVRVTDPDTAGDLEDLIEREDLPVTIFANTQGAEGLHPSANLTVGVAEGHGYETPASLWRDSTEARTAAAAVQRATGEYPQYFLATPKANLAALIDAPPHTQVVIPEEASKTGPRPGLLVVETFGLTPDTARLQLEQTLRLTKHEGLECVQLAQL